MIVLVHAAPTTLAPYKGKQLGVLSSPRRFYLDVEGWSWAADNDAFSDWSPDRYLRMLDAIRNLPGCLFVTAPDVVGDHARTLELFDHWWGELEDAGQPLALVAQDGLTVDQVPWDRLDALFIGGGDQFKLSDATRALVYAAKTRGKWVHMGRVNSHQRMRFAKALAVDSIDGTSLSWFRDRWLPEFLAHAGEPGQMFLV